MRVGSRSRRYIYLSPVKPARGRAALTLRTQGLRLPAGAQVGTGSPMRDSPARFATDCGLARPGTPESMPGRCPASAVVHARLAARDALVQRLLQLPALVRPRPV